MTILRRIALTTAAGFTIGLLVALRPTPCRRCADYARTRAQEARR